MYRKIAEENGGQLPPDARLYMAQVGGIYVPLGKLWFMFLKPGMTTYSQDSSGWLSRHIHQCHGLSLF